MTFARKTELSSSDERRSWLEHCLSLTSAAERTQSHSAEDQGDAAELFYCCCTVGLCAVIFALMGVGVLRVAEDMMQTSQPSYPGYLGTPSAWRF